MRSDALRRRQAILAAARTVFAHGPDSGTLEEVARVAKVGIATVYRNFKDKDALLIATLDELLARIVDVQSTALKRFADRPETALSLYAHDLINLGLAPLIVNADDARVQDLMPHYEEVRDQLTTNNREIIALAKQHDLVRRDITSLFFISGLIQSARPPAQTILPPIADLEHQMVDVFLAGLTP
ncbi:transcriptional regulator BetI [Corynebacterium kalinowskii]|uniref:Transcriptional regulator BetI n=1 Tax=Corynebacterium kalinowskii TaxID=2675216 RepID=A0A6B8VRA0_9CORY|nr:TetR/AcrR family transcriptional regulator [Corynebacterium kalinowskii]QGU02127.1 transcriptional regulator BetI [Corynebacterium kalinowskii]